MVDNLCEDTTCGRGWSKISDGRVEKEFPSFHRVLKTLHSMNRGCASEWQK
jgi:hypothetical protein